MMAEKPDQPDVSSDDGDEAEPEEMDYAKLNALEVMQNLLAVAADWQENGIPILFASSVEDTSEDGEHEYTAFTELRGCHLALKEQNKVLAKGVTHLGRIADSLDAMARASSLAPK
jgi:hypothetical protein